MESSRATREREFEHWVGQRLAHWPTRRIVEFERWLRERDAHEFLPAVHEMLRCRGMGPRAGNVRGRPKRLVHARSLLEVDGASLLEIEADN